MTETEAAGCCALNGENGWVRFTDYQSAFRVVGSPPGEYEELIQSIDALPEWITIADQPLVESLTAQYDALSPEDQQMVTNYDRLEAAQDEIDNITENFMSPNDSPFTYHLDFSYALYLMTAPNHMSGQEFIPDFSELTAVVAYLDMDANNTITLSIAQDTLSDGMVLYTEDFEVANAYQGWYKFVLSEPVSVTPGEKYDITMTSSERAVWFGNLSTVTDSMGCYALNYDIENPSYGGWVRETHTVAFQAVGRELPAYELLIQKINQLPEEITINYSTTIANLRSEYEALSEEDQAKVTNYDRLVAAEERLEELLGSEQDAEIAEAIELITAIGSDITLDSFEAISAADQAVEELVEKYGNDVVDRITNYSDLTQARADYNALIQSFQFGDINGDGNIDAGDALLSLQHSVQLTQITGDSAYAADVNGDGNIDAGDALLILQYSVHLIDGFDASKPEQIDLQTSRNKALFEATYQSLIDRTTETGYANTSITGAYPGMFVRDTSIQIMAHVACGDYDQARLILQYTLSYHELYEYDFALHVMNNNTGPISTRLQADTTFFLLHAWYQFASQAPDTEENRQFIEQHAETVKAFADYFFDNGYFNEELGLLRNPSLEHSRDGCYFNGYDLLTNVYASQALHELAAFFQESDPENAEKWDSYADQIAEGIHTNLVAEVDGQTIYAEMRSIDKEYATTGQKVEDENFYIGFSWVNMSPVGAGWYALDPDIMNNTYEKYLEYGSITYYNEYQMLEVFTTFHSPEDYQVTGNHVIGKGLAWELMFCYDTGRYERVRELIRFLEENSVDMYRETWGYSGGGSDTANQEHASWMIVANEYVCHFSNP